MCVFLSKIRLFNCSFISRNTLTEAGQELYLTVLEAKELIGPSPCETDEMDTFVRIYLVPDETNALQTKTFRDSLCPSYQESFSFWIDKKPIKRSLWFHLYHTSSKAHTLIGKTIYSALLGFCQK
jgi:synaptotagmin-12